MSEEQDPFEPVVRATLAEGARRTGETEMSAQQRSQGQILGVGFASALSGVHVREPFQPTPDQIAEWRRKEEEQRKAYEEQQRKEHRKQLRDAFAMAALTGLVSDPACGEFPPCAVSNTAYEYADAMLKARGDE